MHHCYLAPAAATPITASPVNPITASPVNSTAADRPTATRPSSAQPSRSPQRAASTSISLSQPPGTYTIQQYVLCGQQFGIFPGGDLVIYPAVPKVMPSGPDAARFLIVALGADCRHGANVSVAPTGAAKITSTVFADDGKPLVVMITPQNGKPGVVTFTPANGSPVRTKIG